jgi:sodium/potassium-transporting ATPase subunit alpha
MNCYGFPFHIYYRILTADAYIPDAGITFNDYLGNPDTTFRLNTPFIGYNNSQGESNFYNGDCNQSHFKTHGSFPNWFTNVNNNVDLRAVYVECCENKIQNYYCPQFTWPSFEDIVHTVSPISGHEVAFTTEALFYAQSGYFSTVAIIQWSNMIACKSKRVSTPLFR